MTDDVIEQYDTFNTKVFPHKIIFGDLNYQSIPYKYYNLLNDDNDDDSVNNIPRTPVYDELLDNEGVEDAVMPSYEEINNEIIINYDISLDSWIDHLQNEILEIEGVDNETKGRENEGVDAENEGVDS